MKYILCLNRIIVSCLTSADRAAGSLLRHTLLLQTRELWTVTRDICLGAVHKPVVTRAHVTRGNSVNLPVC